MPIQIYYAHAMCIYDTETEANEIWAIAKSLPYFEIVNPSLLQLKVNEPDTGMVRFYRIIDGCRILVFSRLLGKITSGVGLEVNYALRNSIPVYELKNSRISKVYARVSTANLG